MSRNIWLSYTLVCLYNSFFWLGIWVFYYLRFTDYAGIGLIEMIVILLGIGLEIPTGVIADSIGKRKALILAFLFSAAGNMIFGLSTSFGAIIVSVLVFCTGSALYSGTMDALQYDSLKQEGKEALFAKVISRSGMFVMLSLAVSSVVGGWMYELRPGLPFLALAGFQFVGALLTLFLREPIIDSEKGLKMMDFWRNLKTGFCELFRVRREGKGVLVYLAGGVVVAVVCYQALNDLQGVELGFSPKIFGMVVAGWSLLSAITSFGAHRLLKRFDRLPLVVGLCLILGLTLVVSPWMGLVMGVVVIGIRVMVQSVLDVASSDTINQEIRSEHRTTTISTFNMLKNIPYAILAIALGEAMNGVGVSYFAFFLGVFLFVYVGFHALYRRLAL